MSPQQEQCSLICIQRSQELNKRPRLQFGQRKNKNEKNLPGNRILVTYSGNG
jgi:hypothetical protein